MIDTKREESTYQKTDWKRNSATNRQNPGAKYHLEAGAERLRQTLSHVLKTTNADSFNIQTTENLTMLNPAMFSN